MFHFWKPVMAFAIAVSVCIGCGPSRADIESQLASAVDILEHEQKRQAKLKLELLQFQVKARTSMASDLRSLGIAKVQAANSRVSELLLESAELSERRKKVIVEQDGVERRETLAEITDLQNTNRKLHREAKKEAQKESDAWSAVIREGKIPPDGPIEAEAMRLLDERDTQRAASGIDGRLAEAKEAVNKAQARVDELRDQLRRLGG